MRSWFILAGILAFTGLAEGQTNRQEAERVTVTGTRSRQVLEHFVESIAASTRMTDKIPRWKDGICPTGIGLKPEFLKFVIQRVREIAKQVGAPVNTDAKCKSNIEIVFTTKPQALADWIRQKHEIYIGYSDTVSRRIKMATVTHPIQAWYATQTGDARGMTEVDNPRGGGVNLMVGDPINPSSVVTMTMSNAHGRNVLGSRLGDGLSSSFYHVIIAAEPDKLLTHEIGPLADYIAMIALSQLKSLDTCQELPSIVNMLAPGCERQVNTLTENDLAYLRGLYKMGLDRNLRVQRSEVASHMERSLEGR